MTYEVVVKTDNPDHKLIPGLTANLTINVIEKKGVLLVPNKAFAFSVDNYPESESLPRVVGKAQGNNTVWVLENNTLVPRTVVRGTSNGINTMVVSGLKSGDKVALGVTQYASNDNYLQNKR